MVPVMESSRSHPLSVRRHAGIRDRQRSTVLVAAGAFIALPLLAVAAPAAAYASAEPSPTAMATGIPFGHLPNDPNDHPEIYGGPRHAPLLPPALPPQPQLANQSSPDEPGDG
jgi:hypothetical protein